MAQLYTGHNSSCFFHPHRSEVGVDIFHIDDRPEDFERFS